MLSSIIICAYNHLHDLTIPSIRQLIANTYQPYELILIDDGSQDETYQFFKTLTRKAFRNARNSGVAKSRNRGMRAAQGEILIFLDNDVFVPPGWLGIILNEHQKLNVGILGGIPSNEHFKLSLPVSQDGLIDYPHVSGACFSFKRLVMDRIGYLDESFLNCGEDTDFCYRAYLAGFRVCSTPRLIVEHKHYSTRGELDQRKIFDCVEKFGKKWQRYSHIFPIRGPGGA